MAHSNILESLKPETRAAIGRIHEVMGLKDLCITAVPARPLEESDLQDPKSEPQLDRYFVFAKDGSYIYCIDLEDQEKVVFIVSYHGWPNHMNASMSAFLECVEAYHEMVSQSRSQQKAGTMTKASRKALIDQLRERIMAIDPGSLDNGYWFATLDEMES